jgi:hypothetical protein
MAKRELSLRRRFTKAFRRGDITIPPTVPNKAKIAAQFAHIALF